MLTEIQTPNLCVSDYTINHFVELVRGTTKFDMIDILFIYYFPELYQECDADDIQILFGGETRTMDPKIPNDSIETKNKVGHFISIFYNSSCQTVYVYDSLNSNSLHTRQIQIINFRYPKKKHIKFIEPKIQQADSTSCGPFAIAYLTTLIMGGDPATYEFKIDINGIDHSSYLRKHIEKMFKDKKLSHFPRNEHAMHEL